MIVQLSIQISSSFRKVILISKTTLNINSSYFCRLRELHTLKGHVESVVKLKGLDIETIQQHYTV